MPGDMGAGCMPAEMERSIAALRVKFTEDVDSRILFFEAALAQVRDGADRLAAAQSIRDAAHGIAGLAPSLGFAEVGAAAVQTEHVWDRLSSGTWSQAEMDAAIETLDDLLDRLEATLEL
ncbi:Hpt domain-containing protein [Roseovarius salis]|uniref:Hpt domain-containing protein n=1 Tax=Roseovarius salis TaxID=3376063 RepID=UPI0037CA10C4